MTHIAEVRAVRRDGKPGRGYIGRGYNAEGQLTLETDLTYALPIEAREAVVSLAVGHGFSLAKNLETLKREA